MDQHALQALRQLGADGPEYSEGHRPLTPVRWSKDLERVLNLPLREVLDPQGSALLAEALTKPEGELALWSLQAEALHEAMAANGLFAPIAVGGGKTLIAALLPTVIDCKRPVTMTTPGLLKQGMAMMEDYRRSFYIREDLIWIPYSKLSAKSSSDLLDQLEPDLIVADEAHTLTGDSSRARRFARYLEDHPETRCCFLSGTMAQRSIRDFAKLLAWSLGEGSPLPLHYPDLKEWSEALDVPGPDDRPRPAGELARLCKLGEPVREAWQRRMRSTSGVVASKANTSTTAKLEVVGVEPPCPPEVQEALRDLHATWETPDGQELMWAMDLSRVARQLRLGGYYREVWAEGVSDADVAEYKQARREWAGRVRELLKRPREGLDSPALIEEAVRTGHGSVLGEVLLSAWDEVRRRVPAPGREWVWLTDEVVLWAAQKARQSPRIVFTDVTAVGRAVAQVAGVPYYGAGEKAGQGILREDGTRSVVASIQAHGTGRNLQMFADALVLGGLPSGKGWEQLLGRLHRAGQGASVVTYEVAFEDEVERARRDAEFVQQILGNEQKLMGGAS